MTLPASGIINLSDIQTEFGGANPIGLSEYYRGGAYVTSNNTGVPTSGAIGIADFYGAVNQFSFTISSSTQEANLNTLAIAAGWDGSAPLLCNVASSVYVWSDNTSNPGLLLNVVDATVVNNGYIMGKGGAGGGRGNNAATSGSAGGPAINITASGVVITNSIGAYIAGGGGGGGGSEDEATNYGGGGGGSYRRDWSNRPKLY